MDSLQMAIRNLIQQEDPKRPLTDQEMADSLSENRVKVTVARQRMGITDSRERGRNPLGEDLASILRVTPDISDRDLTAELGRRGYSISRFSVNRLRKAAMAIPSSLPPETGNGLNVEPAAKVTEAPWPKVDPFSRLVGSDGSLKPSIQQAKAAVLYPPNGLHTLILGPAGVGKNELAEAMYRFALEARSSGSTIPFVAFNCADYADNPQLLLSQLFGHTKGAFTGADSSKVGLAEKANGGILFLDEVHRLPAEGQEILFHLIDRNRFRRLGETESERQAAVMIIAATTENPESSLLVTFRRRIPMVIDLPPLARRPMSERLNIIKQFLREEAARTGVPIKITTETLSAFLLYDCPGNVGQLKSDIQVASARGFLAYVSERSDVLEIDVSRLPNHVSRGLLKISSRRPELEKQISGDMVVYPEKEARVVAKNDLYTLPGQIYQYIEKRYAELNRGGLSEAEVNQLIGAEIEGQLRQHIRSIHIQTNPVLREDLVNVVGKELVDIVDEMLDIARREMLNLDQHLFYCLAIHLNAALERLRQGKHIRNPHLREVKREYVSEFRLAHQMTSFINRRLGVALPEDEAGFLAMYLRGSLLTSAEKPEARVGVVVMSHGKVASAMVEVANRLLGVTHAGWVEMSLDESPEVALFRATQVVREVEEGKGVLILVDMGSFLTFGELIREKTGIATITVDRMDTIMVIEAIRWSTLPGATLEEVAASVAGSRAPLTRALSRQGHQKTALVTLCLTGEGTATRLMTLLERIMGRDEVEIIPIGATDKTGFTARIDEISRRTRIAAIVGTVDPRHPTIPFIPAEAISGRSGASLVKRSLERTGVLRLSDLLHEDLIVVSGSCQNREEVIERLGQLLLAHGCVSQAFLAEVYKRELMAPTALGNGVAIPHGDPNHVLRPAIAIATLRNPVDWGGQPADVVCLLALGTVDRDTFTKFYEALQAGPKLDRIRRAATGAEIKEAIING